MSSGYDFDAEAGEGIFDDPKQRAAGDGAALEDMKEEHALIHIEFVPGDDGLPVPALDDWDLEGEPITVTWRELLCLAGPCRWYTETVQRAGKEDQDLIQVRRYCNRLRTWAENTSLDDARVYGCTSFEPDPSGNPIEIAEAIAANASEIVNIRCEAAEQGVQLGVCAVGPCEEFLELVRHPDVKNTEDVDRESLRFCRRLGGLGRLFDLRKDPVLACSAYRPRGTGTHVSQAAVNNAATLEKIRNKMAGAGQKEPTDAADTDDATE